MKFYVSWVPLLLAAVCLSSPLQADEVVVGSSRFGCRHETLLQQPSTVVSVSTGAALPAACMNLRGNWSGGCFSGAVKSTATTPTGEGIYGPETILPENVWTDADLGGEPDLVATHNITINQTDCRAISVTAPEKTPLHQWSVDFSSETSVKGFTRFRRTCDSDGNKWRRTFDMTTHAQSVGAWQDGTLFTTRSSSTGSDKNYGASFRSIHKARYYWQGDRLRIDSTFWEDRKRYDPVQFDWDPGNFGGRICIFQKLN